MRCLFLFLLTLSPLSLASGALAEDVEQHNIPYMRHWPTLPNPFYVRDWMETARQLTLLTLDAESELPYFPVTNYFQQDQPLSGGTQGQQFGVQTYLRSTKAPAH